MVRCPGFIVVGLSNRCRQQESEHDRRLMRRSAIGRSGRSNSRLVPRDTLAGTRDSPMPWTSGVSTRNSAGNRLAYVDTVDLMHEYGTPHHRIRMHRLCLVGTGSRPQYPSEPHTTLGSVNHPNSHNTIIAGGARATPEDLAIHCLACRYATSGLGGAAKRRIANGLTSEGVPIPVEIRSGLQNLVKSLCSENMDLTGERRPLWEVCYGAFPLATLVNDRGRLETD
jgi:hypothetical protein